MNIKGLSKAYDGKTLFQDLQLKMEGGERIALLGDNGCGKSTLIKIINGEETPDTGRIKLGPSCRIAYLPQIISFDNPSRDMVTTMLYAKKNISTQTARNRLAAFHFQGEDVFKSVSVLSGGEQSRLRLCMLMDEEVNFLILDEPTNHLDIASREWIEEAVENYDGALLFVSHDRYFIERFATRIWVLENGTITDYPMGFKKYRALLSQQEKQPVVKEHKPEKKQNSGKKNPSEKKQLAACEREIATLEQRLSQVETDMETYACDATKLNELYEEKEKLDQELLEKMDLWETLASEVEA